MSVQNDTANAPCERITVRVRAWEVATYSRGNTMSRIRLGQQRVEGIPRWSIIGGAFDPEQDESFFDTAQRKLLSEGGLRMSEDSRVAPFWERRQTAADKEKLGLRHDHDTVYMDVMQKRWDEVREVIQDVDVNYPAWFTVWTLPLSGTVILARKHQLAMLEDLADEDYRRELHRRGTSARETDVLYERLSESLKLEGEKVRSKAPN